MKKNIIILLSMITLMTSIINAQQKLDKSALDIPYYEQLKGEKTTINVYNWGEYIADGSDDSIDVNKEFEELTGIKINYTTYASNEEMYVKIKLGGVSYDVIIPSDYTVAKLIKYDLIQKLDYSKIPNYTNISRAFLNPIYDPLSEYSIPYAWGITGIIYNKKVVDKPEEEVSWDLLFDEDYSDQILMYYNPRDSFSVGAAYLGYSLNTTNETEIRNIAQALKEQKPIVQAYVMDEIYDKMESEEAAIGVYYAGDSLTMVKNNTNLNFIIPKNGANLYVDSVAIPKNAENVFGAYIYINFLNEPQIALENINYVQYASPNDAAIAIMSEEIRNNKKIYPDDKTIKSAEVFLNLPNETTELVSGLWSEILSTDETYKAFFIPIMLVIMIIVCIIIISLIKRKKRDNMRR